MIKTILNKFKNQSTTSVLGNKYVIDKLNEVFADSSNVRLSSVDSVTKGQSDSANLLIEEIENDLRTSYKPKVNVEEITVRDLLQKYG